MKKSLTFDDVLLEPRYSEVLPGEVKIETTLSRGFSLSMPILSAAMDTVTESAMAIAMAQSGGLGIIHKNLSPLEQADELEKVKRFESGVVFKPVTISPDMTLEQVQKIKEEKNVSGFPVVTKDGTVAGILTNRDMRFETSGKRLVGKMMTPKKSLVCVQSPYTIKAVKKLLQEHRIERIVITDKKGKLKGLLTVKDILNSEQFPNASKDKKGRLFAGAAVGTNDSKRADALVEAGADCLVLDSAHGHSKGIIDAVKALRARHKRVLLIAGNIATAKGALALANAGADVVKVGIGPGSICTTRIVAGIGVPQISAIQSVAGALAKYRRDIGIIADGGMRYSGDIVKAIVAGADAVMVGNMLAGTEETPGDIDLFQGRAYKRYRGMGSLSAMRRGSQDRYFQGGAEKHKLVPEGVEGRIPYRGKVADVLFQIVGGVRSAMGYLGASNLAALKNAEFIEISNAGVAESHVHDIEITKEAPNYQL